MVGFLLHPNLEIDVSPSEFVFRQDGNVVRMRTVVEPDVGAGVRWFGMEGYQPPRHPLALFAPGGNPAHSRTEHLRAWLRVGLIECQHGRRILLRPHATVHDAASLDAVLLGYQYALLRSELIAAGARTVRFTERPPLAPPAGYEKPVSSTHNE
ncbi:hypothetical protein [Longimicrobium sp.]|uniref:hypothetical protein n=1 Tax=Longimicrobium sp. TaxID=2029185 RepID=UPI003B3B3E30